MLTIFVRISNDHRPTTVTEQRRHLADLEHVTREIASFAWTLCAKRLVGVTTINTFTEGRKSYGILNLQ